MNQVTSTVELVTPALAELLLSKNGINRAIKHKVVQRYADIMGRGKWVINGESIVIGESGRLLDGQHRLAAIVKHGSPVEMFVVRGVKNESVAFETLNSGAVRNLSDKLQARGESHSALLAASVRLLYQYQNGMRSNLSSSGLPPDVMFSLLQDHADIRNFLERGSRLNKLGFNPSIMTFLLYAGSRYSPVLSEGFGSLCETGENLDSTSPVFHLRNRIMRRLNKASLSQVNRITECAVYIKAWNAFAEGVPVGVLRWSPIEPFPEITGFPILVKGGA